MVIAYKLRARYNTKCNGCGYLIAAGTSMVFVPGEMKRQYGDWHGKWQRGGAHFHDRCNPGFATRRVRKQSKLDHDPGDYDLDMWEGCEDPDIGDR